MLVLSKELKMFGQAYPGLTDMDGDGRVDTGFNPAALYVGYFDPGSCYAYKGSERVGVNDVFAVGDRGGYFVRAGDAIPDQSAEEIRKSRPKYLKGYVVSPRSVAGVCSNLAKSVTHGGRRTFSGNWLNHLAASRMDVIRKVLYGGTRSVDTPSRTVLEHSFVPPDANAWGGEVRSDDTWQAVTPNSAWYDVRKYTPFEKPGNGKSHFFARSSDLGLSNGYFPALKVLLNVDATFFNVGGKDSVSQPVTHSKPWTRYWDWVLVNRPLPDDRVLKPAARAKVTVYNLKVEACEANNISPTENCQLYPGAPGGASGEVHKPVGLLQRYGSGARPINFGLITGGFNSDIRTAGGKLRNHVGPVHGVAGNAGLVYVPPVNLSTGQVNDKGLIKNIDNLRVSGRPTNKNPAAWEGQSYHNVFSWGNPVAEMLYEGVRYLAGAMGPTPAYSAQNDRDEPGSPINDLTAFGAGSSAWDARRPDLGTGRCSKVIVLLISDPTADHDGDQFLSDCSLNLMPNLKLPGNLTERGNLPPRFDKNVYLDTISKLEGITGWDKYAFSRSPSDDCRPKNLGSLKDIKGLCPFAPSTEGTYSVAAVAYYGRVHDFRPLNSQGGEGNNLDLFTVSVSPAFPELVFDMRDGRGKTKKSVSIFPAAISEHPSSRGKILGVLNYYVIDWKTDRNGLPFRVKIKVNFSDQVMGDDWEGDAAVTYEITLLTDQFTPLSMRETSRAVVDSGESYLRNQTWYAFRNPATAETVASFAEIKPEQVKAILIKSSYEVAGTGMGMAMGYSVSGTAVDGTYMDITMNLPPASPLLTPAGCPYTGARTSSWQGCGRRVANVKSQARIFGLTGSKNVKDLPDPLWLAAKYGGFTDKNQNGVPDTGEWEGGGGDPKNYFRATNVAELPDKLEKAFHGLALSISRGVATSASVNTVLGSGLSLQSYYYPLYADPNDLTRSVDWVGGVYGLFLDRFGNLREDTDGDGILTLRRDPVAKTGDNVVTFGPKTASQNPPVCHDPAYRLSVCQDVTGNGDLVPETGAAAHPGNLHRLRPLFDTAKWLAGLDPTKLLSGSRPHKAPATVTDGRRLIYYGQPTGSGQGVRLQRFNVAESWDLLTPLMLSHNFAETLPTVRGDDRKSVTKRLIEYVTGQDAPGWRPRAVNDPWGGGGKITWRHGDVINSKPVLVGAPAFGYDYLHGDEKYGEFKRLYGRRRQVLYYGANDGMLHAVNLGFLTALKGGKVAYAKTREPGQAAHDIGAEMWAYVPTSALPHLQWLADPQYVHADYVDLKPAVADVLINGQWRTILIGGMRLGGRPIEAAAPGGPQGDHYFSEIFCLDVTDPEAEPRLLWRHSSLRMGLAVGMPALVRSGDRFYAVIPSGPVTDEPKTGPTPWVEYGRNDPGAGHSNQRARLLVLNVHDGSEVVNTDPKTGGDPNYLTAMEDDSFFNEPFLPASQPGGPGWNHPAVYFGLTQSRDPLTGFDRGAVYRLQMVDGYNQPLKVTDWKLKRLISVDRPVTGAVNSARDRLGNLWVLFGTGRLWGYDDLNPCLGHVTPACRENHRQYLFGVKEPLNGSGFMTFADLTPDATKLLDLTGATVHADGTVNNVPAQPSLIALSANGSATYLSVLEATMGDRTIGYRRKLEAGKLLDPQGNHDYEMALSQPKIVPMGGGQSLMALTAFEPSGVDCGAFGAGYQYAVDTFTGLPNPLNKSSFVTPNNPSLPPGLITGAIAMGPGKPTESVILNFEGKTVIRASSSEGGVFDIDVATPGTETGTGGLTSWREVMDIGLDLPKETMTKDLP
jgi:type IV pilus assembly protein PilY1